MMSKQSIVFSSYLIISTLLASCIEENRKNPTDYIAGLDELSFDSKIILLNVPVDSFNYLGTFVNELMAHGAEVVVIAEFISSKKYYSGPLDTLLISKTNLIIPNYAAIPGENPGKELLYKNGIKGFMRYLKYSPESELTTSFTKVELDYEGEQIRHIAIEAVCAYDITLCEVITGLPGNQIDIRYYGNEMMYPIITPDEIGNDCNIKNRIVIVGDLETSSRHSTPLRFLSKDSLNGPDMPTQIVLANAIQTLLNKSPNYVKRNSFSVHQKNPLTIRRVPKGSTDYQ